LSFKTPVPAFIVVVVVESITAVGFIPSELNLSNDIGVRGFAEAVLSTSVAADRIEDCKAKTHLVDEECCLFTCSLG